MNSTRSLILKLEERILSGGKTSCDEAERLMETQGTDLMFLFASANNIRAEKCGDAVHLCGIVNAKRGACSEDCRFCSQSARHHTGIEKHSLLDPDEMVSASREAVQNGATGFGIVTAWKGIKKGKDLDAVCEAVRRIKSEGKVSPHVSLGLIQDPDVAVMLARAGVEEYNINLESSRDFFPEICTTHTYDDRINTIRLLKAAGIKVCCGGIFGIGESVRQRVALGMELQALVVDTTPLNFYHHTEGNAIQPEGLNPVSPLEALKIAAVFRFILPQNVIKIAGGREMTLGQFQSLMFLCGLNSSMAGNYLTTQGRDARLDLELIQQSGLSH